MDLFTGLVIGYLGLSITKAVQAARRRTKRRLDLSHVVDEMAQVCGKIDELELRQLPALTQLEKKYVERM